MVTCACSGRYRLGGGLIGINTSKSKEPTAAMRIDSTIVEAKTFADGINAYHGPVGGSPTLRDVLGVAVIPDWSRQLTVFLTLTNSKNRNRWPPIC